MRYFIVLILTFSALVVGCGDSATGSAALGGDGGGTGGGDGVGQRQVVFNFDLAQRQLNREGTTTVPSEATSFRFTGQTDEFTRPFTTTEEKAQEIILTVGTDITSIKLDVLAGNIVILSNIFPIPDQDTVVIANPVLEPVAFTGATGLVIEPQNPELMVDSTQEFTSFLTDGSVQVDVTAFSDFTSSDESDLDFIEPEQPNVGFALSPGDSTVTATFEEAQPEVIVGAASGISHVRIVDATMTDQGSLGSFFAFNPSFTGGVNVATGDVNGDGTDDIIVGAANGLAQVRVIDGTNSALLADFFAFDLDYTGGVTVGAGDATGDGKDDIIVGAASGLAHVRVFNGNTLQLEGELVAFDEEFTGGASVALGDINNDGFDDAIVGAAAGGGPHVRVFDSQTGDILADFFAFDLAFAGGVTVAAGDVTGDGRDDIIVGAGAGGGPHVRVFEGQSQQQSAEFFAFDASFTGGVNVATGDVNGDGRADIITGAGPGGGPRVRVFDDLGTVVLSDAFVFTPSFTGGVSVAGIESPGTPNTFRAQTDVTITR